MKKYLLNTVKIKQNIIAGKILGIIGLVCTIVVLVQPLDLLSKIIVSLFPLSFVVVSVVGIRQYQKVYWIEVDDISIRKVHADGNSVSINWVEIAKVKFIPIVNQLVVHDMTRGIKIVIDDHLIDFNELSVIINQRHQ